MYMKIQTQIVKSPGAWKREENGEFIFFYNGIIAVKIPKGECVLNAGKFEKCERARFFVGSETWEPVEGSNIYIKVKKLMATQLTGRNNNSCWIAREYYRQFSRYTFTYNGKGIVGVIDPLTGDAVAVIAVINAPKVTIE